MTTLAALTTPCLLLEDEKLQANMGGITTLFFFHHITGRPMEIHRQFCCFKRIHLLSQQSGRHACQHISGSSCGHSIVAGIINIALLSV